MKRLTVHVSGNVQDVGYRARVVQMANALKLTGIVENLLDGRVRIIAEGDDEKLKWFEEAIDIKNTLIQVSSIEKNYSLATGDFSGFYKLVGQGETDSRLDRGIDILKKILVAVEDMNANLGGKMDKMLDKQDQMLDKQDATTGEIRGLRVDMKSYMDMKFERIEADLQELKEMKIALKEKGII